MFIKLIIPKTLSKAEIILNQFFSIQQEYSLILKFIIKLEQILESNQYMKYNYN